MADYRAITRLGGREIYTATSEGVYLTTGLDLTRPSEIRALLTDRCNYKCLQCQCWRQNKVDEMTIDQWKAALASLKEFLGFYLVQFVGGEPFVKKGFLDLLEFCRAESIDFGVITNGSIFHKADIAERFVKTRPMKLEISVDGPTAETHDHLRGHAGSLARISEGIRKIQEIQGRLAVRFPIRIKATMNAVNYRSMPDLVKWAVDHGATTIDIEPIREWTVESRTILWPKLEEMQELEQVIDRLIWMKLDGAPIETSERKLLNMPDHFRREKVAPELATCRVGLRTFEISPQGLVTSCGSFGPLGEITRQTAREIWTGAKARELRPKMVGCTRGCAYGCLASKSLPQKIKRGLQVFGI